MMNPFEVCLLLSPGKMKLLLDAACISRWLVCSGDTFDDDEYRDEIESLQQDLFRQAREAGCDDMLYTCPEDGALKHAPFEASEGTAWQAVEDYNNDCFFSELIRRMSEILAQRDVDRMQRITGESLDMAERINHHEGRVRQLLEHGGLEGLMLMRPQQAG